MVCKLQWPKAYLALFTLAPLTSKETEVRAHERTTRCVLEYNQTDTGAVRRCVVEIDLTSKEKEEHLDEKSKLCFRVQQDTFGNVLCAQEVIKVSVDQTYPSLNWNQIN